MENNQNFESIDSRFRGNDRVESGNDIKGSGNDIKGSKMTEKESEMTESVIAMAATRLNLGAILASLYVSFQLIANILAVKIALIPFTQWAIAGGTIIYPLTFTLRDFVHKTLGKKQARQIVILAALVNIAMALLLILVGKMSPDPFWNLQEAYEKILLPVWRITLASIIAQVISELVDTEVFSWAYRRFGDIKAVLLSNNISIIIDSVLFVGLAFYGRLPFSVLMQIGVANLLVKFVLSLVSTPAIKYVPRTVEIEKI